jgi:hypothetical protein
MNCPANQQPPQNPRVYGTNVVKTYISIPVDDMKSLVSLEVKGRSRAGLALLNRGSQKYEPVKGLLDSGADFSVGSIQKHGKYVGRKVVPKNPTVLKLGNGEEIEVEYIGYITVQVTSLDTKRTRVLSDIRVAMVGEPRWTEFLVGQDVLQPCGLMPDQNI